jgi:hypothetical protein
MTSQYKSAEKVRQCLRELKLECEEDNPVVSEKNKNAIIGRREAYRFYSKIVKDVEIFYKPKETLSEQERKKFKEFFNNEQYKTTEENFQKLADLKGDVQKVVFFIDPTSLFAQESDRNDFMDNSPRDKNEKLNYLLEYMPNFKSRIFMRRKLWKKQNNLLNALYNINYRNVIIISTLLSFLVNLLVLRSSFYIKEGTILKNRALLEENYYDYDDNYLDYEEYTIQRIKNNSNMIYSMKNYLQEPDENSDDKKTDVEEKKDEEKKKKGPVWIRQELNTALIIFLTIINIIFIIFIISNWLYFEYIKYEKDEDEEDEEGENKSQGELNSMNNNANVENKSNEEVSFSLFDAIKK